MMFDIAELYPIEPNKVDDDSIFKTWLILDGGAIQATRAIRQLDRLKAGVYDLEKNQNTITLTPAISYRNNITALPNQDVSTVTSELRQFWNMKDDFKALDLVHKRGILIHGPPGTGKSTLLGLISNICVKEFDGLVFYVRHRNDLLALVDFANLELYQLERGRNIVTIIEGIENIYAQDPELVTAFLDGEEEIEHNVTIATTNYIDKLDQVLTRHSRFDQIIEVVEPDEADRKVILTKNFKFEEGEELDQWVEHTKGMSIAAIKELYVLVKLFKNDMNESLERIKNHNTLVSKQLVRSNKKQTSVGFGFGG